MKYFATVVSLLTLLLSAFSANAESDFMQRIRTTSWGYPVTLTLDQARESAKLYDEQGHNAVLTESHRYILPLPDDPEVLNDPFHFKLQPTEKSHEATSNVVTALHERGMKAIHHVTAAYCPKKEMEKHPDWCMRSIKDPDKPLFFREYGGVYLYCLNNPDFRKAYYAAALDLQKKMKFDGWMIDEVEWLPDWYVCGCTHCREKFHKETGYTLPTDKYSPVWGNFNDPIWRDWLAARMRWSGDFFKDLRSHFTQNGISPDLPLTACHAGMTAAWSSQYWGIDVVDLTRGINWIFYEVYLGESGSPFHSWKRVLAEIQAYAALAHSRTQSPAFILFYPKGGVAENSWCWSAAYALGQRLWGIYQPNFKWEQRHEYLSYPNGREIVDTAIVFSKPTRDFTGHRSQPKLLDMPGINFNEGYADEWAAWTESLIENNIPHHVILDDELVATETLKRYKALMLPSTDCLSSVQVKALLEYADAGGKLVVSGTPGRRDETGALRTGDDATTRLLQKASVIIDSNLAKKAYSNTMPTTSLPNTGNPAAQDYLAKMFQKALPDTTRSYQVKAPHGVVVKVWENEQRSRIRIDALNCIGADLTSDTKPLEKYSVRFEPAKIQVTLQANVAGNPDRAVIYDPSTSTSKVIAIKRTDNGDTQVEFDLTSALAIVELERAPLPRNISWCKTQNADWFVLGEKLTPAQAQAAAERASSNSLTTLLTDQHRYILYDMDDFDRTTTGAFQNIWQGRNLRTSIEITRNLVDACHKKNIRVIWHTTYCMVSRDLLERHPSWAQVDLRHPDKPSFFTLYGGNVNICLNNPEARQTYFERVADLTRETGVDGWMIDEVEWLPDWYSCGCKVCREQFEKATGYKLPEGETSPVYGNMESPIWRAWIKWRMDCAGKFFKDLRAFMTTQGLDNLTYTCCHAGTVATWSAQAWGVDEFALADGMNTCFYEAFIGNGAPFFSWKSHVTELDAYSAVARNKTPDLPVLALFYPRTVQESRFVTALTFWSGNRPWITYENTPTDFAPLATVQKHKDFFANGSEKLLAQIGVFFSKPTRDMLGNDAKQDNNRFYINHFKAVDITLTELNTPKQTLIDEDMTTEKLARFKVIIIPQAVCMSQTTAKALVNWANQGGKIVLIGRVAELDETGAEYQEKTIAETLRRAAWKVLPELNVDEKGNIGYAVVDKPWQDGRTASATALLGTLADELRNSKFYSWQGNADAKSAAIRLWQMSDGSLTVHFLNTAGTLLKDGEIVEKSRKDGGVNYPSVQNTGVAIPKTNLPEALVGKQLQAEAVAIDGSTPEVRLDQTDENWTVVMPELKDYAVVKLSPKK